MSTTQPKFRTAISAVAPGVITVRGRGIEDLVASATASESACLVIKGTWPSDTERRMLDAIFAAAADHGFVSTCTSVTRYAASGSGSLPASVAAGLLGLGTGTAVAHLVADLITTVTAGDAPADVTDERIDAVIADLLARGQRIPGVGHPVHKDGDPRTTALREVARQNGCADGNVALMDRVVERFAVVTGRRLTQNVDGILAAVLLDFGWTPDQIFGLTILILTPGLVAHALEEIGQHHVMRIIPEQNVEYVGHEEPTGDRAS